MPLGLLGSFLMFKNLLVQFLIGDLGTMKLLSEELKEH